MTAYVEIENIIGKNNPDLTDILNMRDYVLAIPFETFYEPVSITEGFGNRRKLVNFTPEIINAWVKHVCCSSKVRMLHLEEAALSELSHARLLSSMVLIRSHLEAAGLACLCNDEIRKWLETSDPAIIQELIPPTFLGTSMFRAKKKDTTVAAMLYLSEQDKVPSSRIISALDKFFSSGDSTGVAHSFYGFLCEFTHPNMRALKDHVNVVHHEPEGWSHSYQLQAKLDKEHYIMSLNSLRRSMKAGHTTCEILRRMSSVTMVLRALHHCQRNWILEKYGTN
jgi:hypothetical protein